MPKEMTDAGHDSADGKPQSVKYLYDGLGRRVAQVYSDSWTSSCTIYDGLMPIAEFDGSGNALARYYHEGLGRPIRVEKGEDAWTVLTDDRGSVVGVVNPSQGSVLGEIVEKLHYNMAGLCRAYAYNGTNDTEKFRADGPNFNLGRSEKVPFGYLGMYQDRFTGLYHTHFREYDAIHGRWLSEDPAGYADGLNLYQAYMGVNGTDPLGLDKLTEKWENGRYNIYYTPENILDIDGESFCVGYRNAGSDVVTSQLPGYEGRFLHLKELQYVADMWISGVKTSQDLGRHTHHFIRPENVVYYQGDAPASSILQSDHSGDSIGPATNTDHLGNPLPESHLGLLPKTLLQTGNVAGNCVIGGAVNKGATWGLRWCLGGSSAAGSSALGTTYWYVGQDIGTKGIALGDAAGVMARSMPGLTDVLTTGTLTANQLIYGLDDAAAATGKTTGIQAYEVGTADKLSNRSVVGDGLDIHHVGQARPFEQLIPGYSRSTGPAITVPETLHRTIPTLRGATNLTSRQVLARDIWNLRNYTEAPNSSLQELIELNKQMYPGAF